MNIEILSSLVLLTFSIVFHETAHAWVADKLGDPTARHLGRISLNPIVHIDPVGTIILPALLIMSGSPIIFGAAKPVPVNSLNFKNPKRDMMLVALAGPVSNLILAAIFSIAFRLFEPTPHNYQEIINFYSNNSGLIKFFTTAIMINLMLAIFNLIPIPPLDGGRIAIGLLPDKPSEFVQSLEPYGFFILIALLMTGIADKITAPLWNIFVPIFFPASLSGIV